MKPFTFRLEKILDYRKYLEKRAQIDLYNARNEYIKMEKVVEKLEEKKRKMVKKCGDEELNGIEIPRYKIYQAFLNKLEHDIEKAYDNLREGTVNITAKEAVLKSESIKKKTFEALKDIKYEKYQKEVVREEQKILDEIAILRRGMGL
jgi:flagellar FliJ protein